MTPTPLKCRTADRGPQRSRMMRTRVKLWVHKLSRLKTWTSHSASATTETLFCFWRNHFSSSKLLNFFASIFFHTNKNRLWRFMPTRVFSSLTHCQKPSHNNNKKNTTLRTWNSTIQITCMSHLCLWILKCRYSFPALHRWRLDTLHGFLFLFRWVCVCYPCVRMTGTDEQNCDVFFIFFLIVAWHWKKIQEYRQKNCNY